MAQIVIDAEGTILGRLCSLAAKSALEGSDVIVVNAEKAVVTGNKKDILFQYTEMKKKGGHSLKGPRLSKITSRIVKRSIRGMLPDHRVGIGREAYKRIICYDGVPKEFEAVKKINARKPIHAKFVTITEIAERL